MTRNIMITFHYKVFWTYSPPSLNICIVLKIPMFKIYHHVVSYMYMSVFSTKEHWKQSCPFVSVGEEQWRERPCHSLPQESAVSSIQWVRDFDFIVWVQYCNYFFFIWSKNPEIMFYLCSFRFHCCMYCCFQLSTKQRAIQIVFKLRF